MTPLRFKAVQNHCVPWPLPASRCIAIASRLKANPHRAFAAQYRASPSRFDSSQCHCQTMLCSSVLHPCISVHCFAIPLLYRALLLYRELLHSALPNCTLPLPSIANLCISVAFPGASRRLILMPSHHVSLLLNTSPSPFFAELYSPKPLPRAALTLRHDSILSISFAMPLDAPPCRCYAPPGTADPRRCFARRAY